MKHKWDKNKLQKNDLKELFPFQISANYTHNHDR